MAQKLLSISLGSEIVKVCEVALAGKNKIQVFNAIDLIIPEGLCDDGMILNTGALAGAIKEGLAGEGFSARKIIFSLNSKRIANKEALIPFCKPNRIKDVVSINATEYFPIASLENYTINYSILEIVATEATKNYRLSITATPNELIEQYCALAKAMGMTIAAIDYSGNSILQLLKLQTNGEGVDAILQFGGENTVVNIMNGSTMVMQRSVPYGRSAIADAVKLYRDCSEEEADEILATEDISDLANASEDVADSVRALLSSVSRILEFYRGKNPQEPIEHVYMIGDVSSVEGLVELINQETDGNIEVIDSLRGVEIKGHSSITDEIATNYLANIGAVIAPMNIQQVNDQKTTKSGRAGKMPWWILIFATVIAGVMVGGIIFLCRMAQEENNAIKAQIDALGDVGSLGQEYNKVQADLQAMNAWYDSTKSSNESIVRFVGDLEEVQPKAVAIDRFSSKDNIFMIEGTSYGKPPIAEFVIQLKKLPYVKNVKMEYINETIKEASALDSFSLTLTLEYDDPYADSAEESTTSDESNDYSEFIPEGEVISVEEVLDAEGGEL